MKSQCDICGDTISARTVVYETAIEIAIRLSPKEPFNTEHLYGVMACYQCRRFLKMDIIALIKKKVENGIRQCCICREHVNLKNVKKVKVLYDGKFWYEYICDICLEKKVEHAEPE